MLSARRPVFLIVLGLAICAPAARADTPLKDELRAFTGSMAAQCRSVKEQLESFDVEADPLTGYTLQDAVRNLCSCIPSEMKGLQLRLSPQELAREVTPAELMKLLNSTVVGRCAAEQIRATYDDRCAKRFGRARPDTVAYCSCMKQYVSGYTDAQVADIAVASMDYLPAAAEAERAGQPMPPRPASLAAYADADARCKGEPAPDTR